MRGDRRGRIRGADRRARARTPGRFNDALDAAYRTEREQRRARAEMALELRKQGMTLQKIADRLGVSRERANQLVKRGRAAERARKDETRFR